MFRLLCPMSLDNSLLSRNTYSTGLILLYLKSINPYLTILLLHFTILNLFMTNLDSYLMSLLSYMTSLDLFTLSLLLYVTVNCKRTYVI